MIARHKSPLSPNASSCLENIYLKPKSFPIAVIAEVSVVRAIADKPFLWVLNLPVSSAARCCESAALPPLPAIKILMYASTSLHPPENRGR